MMKAKEKKAARIRRHKRIRQKIVGFKERPRFTVFKSCKGIYAQLIDDLEKETLIAASSLEKDIKGNSKIEVAKLVGSLIAKRALEKDIKEVVFDRGGYLYHGRIKALAESAREAGLKF
ncbi:MAG: 50S ribosomal protein L18 [bacterium]|nr:50S ribosomal protein L18 [bacterium]